MVPSHNFSQSTHDTHVARKLITDETPEVAAVWFDDPPTDLDHEPLQEQPRPKDVHPLEGGPQLIGEAPVS